HQLPGGMQQRIATRKRSSPTRAHPSPGRSLQRARSRHPQRHATPDSPALADIDITVLFVTHNTQEVLYLGTRVIVLAKESPDGGAQIAIDLPIPNHAQR
ncbi:MAG: ABC transporter ATP-binding protein, partial [Candidatus Sulfotelmatobacter sp.]